MTRKSNKNGNNNSKKTEPFRKSDFNIGNFIADHKKYVMPAVLMASLLVTFGVALHAGKSKDNDSSSAVISTDTSSAVASAAEAVLQSAEAVSMEENAHDDVTSLIKNFYDAQAS
jgi:cytolysin (calcineurin-like family phosphatase)